MKKALFKIGFVALLVCIATFLFPMRSSCGCVTDRYLLLMSFVNEEEATDAKLAQAIRTRLEGVNMKNAARAWETSHVGHPGKIRDSFDYFCSPTYPWKNGQTISCKYYDKESFFRGTGWQLDFRITPEGIIRDVKFSSMSTWLGMEMLETIQ